jgi:hypothetical protein
LVQLCFRTERSGALKAYHQTSSNAVPPANRLARSIGILTQVRNGERRAVILQMSNLRRAVSGRQN